MSLLKPTNYLHHLQTCVEHRRWEKGKGGRKRVRACTGRTATRPSLKNQHNHSHLHTYRWGTGDGWKWVKQGGGRAALVEQLLKTLKTNTTTHISIHAWGKGDRWKRVHGGGGARTGRTATHPSLKTNTTTHISTHAGGVQEVGKGGRREKAEPRTCRAALRPSLKNQQNYSHFALVEQLYAFTKN